MIVGIDGCCWSNGRGFGRFTRELVGEMIRADGENEYILFLDADTARRSDLPDVKTVVADTSESPTVGASATGRRSVSDVWALTRAVSRHKLDLFFFPAVYSYYPILNRTRILVTVHDAIADRNPNETFSSRKLLYFWKLKQSLAIRQADRLLTVSNYSRKVICDYFDLPESFVDVTTEGASAVFQPLGESPETGNVLRRYDVPTGGRIILHVGGFSPHKNLVRLVQAVSELRRDDAFSDCRLVLVGDYANDSFLTEYEHIRSSAERANVEDAVYFTGFVPDEDLVHLYNASTLLAFPSLEEGFGLPAIEAMSCGLPVIASDRGSLPEIVASAGRYFDPTDVSGIVDALARTLSDPDGMRAMSREGLLRSEDFSWKKAAALTTDVFRKMVSDDPAGFGR